MVNKPRQKGTSAETAVVSFLRDNGFPHAERRSLKGSQDWGDVTGTPGLAWEVKYANGGVRMAEWMAQTQVEKTNAKADHGILVIKPLGLGDRRTGEWPAVVIWSDWRVLATGPLVAGAGSTSTENHGPYSYTQDRLIDEVAASVPVGRILDDTHRFSTVILQPRGTKEDHDNWLVAMPLEQLVKMVRLSGYGTPLPAPIPRQVSWTPENSTSSSLVPPGTDAVPGAARS